MWDAVKFPTCEESETGTHNSEDKHKHVSDNTPPLDLASLYVVNTSGWWGSTTWRR
jgi:hypothetical protein